MRVFAHVALRSMRIVRARRQSNYHSDWFKVVKLYGPVRKSTDRRALGRRYIYADVEIDDDLRPHVSVGEFNPDGSARVQVWMDMHRKTLAPFLASGDVEWDLRGNP